MDDLFTMAAGNMMAPLAERMRPRSLADFIGQKHLVSPDSLLSRAIRTDKLGSCIFFGPPGTGKTTLASIIAETTHGAFAKMNAGNERSCRCQKAHRRSARQIKDVWQAHVPSA